jgi:hypothetical protein
MASYDLPDPSSIGLDTRKLPDSPPPVKGTLSYGDSAAPALPKLDVGGNPVAGRLRARALAESGGNEDFADLVTRIARQESRFNPDAVGPKTEKWGSARGTLQLIEATFRENGGKNFDDPEDRDGTGVRLLWKNYQKLGGDRERVVAAHHAGLGAVMKAGGVPGTYDKAAGIGTPDYVKQVLGDSAAAQDGMQGARRGKWKMPRIEGDLEYPKQEAPAAKADKGLGQTITEGLSKGIETAGVGMSTLIGSSPAALASQIKDTQIPRSPQEQAFDEQTAGAAKAFDDAKGFGETFRAGLGILGVMARNPKQAAGVVAQSLGMSAPGLAAAGAGAAVGSVIPGVGTAVGAFVGYILGNVAVNVQIETAQKVEKMLAERGVDTNDAAATQQAIEADPEFYRAAREAGIKSGVATGAVEGAVDLATAGLAGKAAAFVRRGATTGAQVARGAAAGVGAGLAQGASEGAGSIAGQAASGEPISLGQAATEAAYGTVSGVPDIAMAFKAGAGRAQPPAAPPGVNPVDPAAPDAPPGAPPGGLPMLPGPRPMGALPPPDTPEARFVGRQGGGPIDPLTGEVFDPAAAQVEGPPGLPRLPFPRERPPTDFTVDSEGNVYYVTPEQRMAEQSAAGDQARKDAWLEGFAGREMRRWDEEDTALGKRPDRFPGPTADDAGIQPGDMLFNGRRPFMLKSGAEAQARDFGGQVVPVKGGFVVRPPPRPAPATPRQQAMARPEIVAELLTMASLAGWEEIGGRMIRPTGDDGIGSTAAPSRTKWIPRDAWWSQMANRLPKDTAGDKTKALVEKAIAGKPLTALEGRVLDEMIGHAQDYGRMRRGEIDEFGTPIPPREPDEIAGGMVDAAPDEMLLDPVIEPERDAIEAEADLIAEVADDDELDAFIEAALKGEGGMTDAELEAWLGPEPARPDEAAADADGAQGAVTEGAGGGDPVRRPEAGADRPGAQQPEAAEGLTQPTPEDLRAKDEAKKKADAKKAAEDKAPPASDFTLTGSNRPADVAAANGQQELAPAPAPAPAPPKQPLTQKANDALRGIKRYGPWAIAKVDSEGAGKARYDVYDTRKTGDEFTDPAKAVKTFDRKPDAEAWVFAAIDAENAPKWKLGDTATYAGPDGDVRVRITGGPFNEGGTQKWEVKAVGEAGKRFFATADELSAVREASGPAQQSTTVAPPEAAAPTSTKESSREGQEAAAKTPEVLSQPGARKAPGASKFAGNKVFTQDAAEKARALLKAKLGGGTLNAGLDPEVIQAGIQLAGAHIEAGARSFGAFVRAMVDDLGDAVRPYLKGWYLAVKNYPGFDAKDMDRASVVEDADVDALADEMPASAGPLSAPERAFVDAAAAGLAAGTLSRITDVRRIYQETTGQKAEGWHQKRADELTEMAVVQATRDTIAAGGTPAAIYDRLVTVYGTQPILGTRTSTSVEQQAYSTPAPLAYLAQRLAGVTPATTVYEPTAGTGMLVTAAAPKKAFVNEMNDDRAGLLEAQGFTVTREDASGFDPGAMVDAVIANPPFGVVRVDGEPREFSPVTGAPYTTREIDHAIAFQALESMKEDGRAVLIVGSVNPQIESAEGRADAYNGKSKREFYYHLYRNYNVTQHFTVSGDLYKKQGASWPVDVIVIEGRGKSALRLPAAQAPAVYDSWDALKGLMNGANRVDAGQPAGDGGRAGGAVGTKPGSDTGLLPGVPGNPGAAPGGSSGGSRGGRGRTSADDGAIGQLFGNDGPDGRGGVDPGVQQPGTGGSTAAGRDPAGGVSPAGDVGQGARGDGAASGPVAAGGAAAGGDRKPAGPSDLGTNSNQVGYAPASEVNAIGTLMPVNMREAVAQALAALRERVGPIDAYVASQLGYEPATLGNYFGAEQVDALGLALDSMSRSAGFIIGDQCVAGDTLIHDPVAGTETPIRALAEAGETIHVMSLTRAGWRPIAASAPFHKGRAELFRVTFDDGESIVVTAGHRFLTLDGWRCLRDGLGVGDYLVSVASSRDVLSLDSVVSNLPPCALAGERRWTHEAPGSRSGCPTDRRSCDEQPLSGLRRLVSVVSEGEGDFFDMKVPGSFNYVAAGVVNHNTGIGKGRVVAGVIRWALKNGKTPIFVTEKPNLYGDMFRDLTDIGVSDIRPVMTNQSEKIPLDEEGKVTLKPMTRHNERLRAMAESGQLEDANIVFTTYSQMQLISGAPTVRNEFLLRFAQDGVVIFDESHNAGGQEPGGRSKKKDQEEGGPTKEGRAGFARRIAGLASGVFYSSATWAKRPEVMDLYFKTDMALAVGGKVELLAEAIQAGGVPLQQVVSAMLAKAGQYIRRERSFNGVEYSTTETAVDHKAAESISRVMLEVARFDDLKKAAVRRVDREFREDASTIAGNDSATGQAGATSTNFTSIMHNLIDQMLLSLKTDAAVDLALQELKAGNKVVLTVANTMGSFIGQYAEDFNLQPGDAVGISFRSLLTRYLERSRRVTIKDAAGNETKRPLTNDELGPEALAQFRAVEGLIRSASGLDTPPISPIDYLHNKLRAAGYKTGEITGRTEILNYGSIGGPTYETRKTADVSIAGRRRTISGFNGGSAKKPLPDAERLDVIVLNQSGSTGLSLHASKTFADQRPRRMLIVQAEKNIDTHMQMLGRIHRTGQVVLPGYVQMVADIPAEKRPAAVLAKKMASLNASTTANRKSAVTSDTVVDFMNDYGDEVAAQLMEDMPDIHETLGTPLSWDGGKLARENAVAKVTGRIPLLPLADQEAVYGLLESNYKDLIEQADAMGQNMLEAKTMQLDARTRSKTSIFAGSGDSPFAADAFAEEVDVKRLGKPLTGEQALAAIATGLRQAGVTVPDADVSRVERLSALGSRAALDTLRAVTGQFRDFHAEMLAATESEEGQAAVNARLTKMSRRFDAAMRQIHIGGSYRLQLPDGASVMAYVTGIRKKDGVKNPVAHGAWQITFVVADAARSFKLPLSKLLLDGESGEFKVGITAMARDPITGQTVAEALDAGQSVTREDRVMMTGNLLAAFSKLSKGQIVNYTDDKGAIQQGVLMPSGFDLKKVASELPIEFTPETAARFLRDDPGRHSVATADGAAWVMFLQSGDVRVVTEKSKQAGGPYFLDKKLRDLLYDDFVSRGSSMSAASRRADLQAVLARVAEISGQRLQTSSFRDEAAKAGGKTALDGTATRRSARPDIARNMLGNLFGARRVANPSRAQEDALATLRNALEADARRAGMNPGAIAGLSVNGAPFSARPIVAALKKAFGIDVVFVGGVGALPTGLDFNGLYVKGDRTIYVAADSPRPFHAVIGHEFLHWLENTSPDAYEAFKDAVAPVLRARAANAAAKEYGSDYAQFGMSESGQAAAGWEELYADTFAEAWSDPAFWAQAINAMAPSLVSRLMGRWTAFVLKVKMALGMDRSNPLIRDLYTDFATVKQAVTAAMAGASPVAGLARGAFDLANPDIRFSLSVSDPTPAEQSALKDLSDWAGNSLMADPATGRPIVFYAPMPDGPAGGFKVMPHPDNGIEGVLINPFKPEAVEDATSPRSWMNETRDTEIADDAQAVPVLVRGSQVVSESQLDALRQQYPGKSDAQIARAEGVMFVELRDLGSAYKIVLNPQSIRAVPEALRALIDSPKGNRFGPRSRGAAGGMREAFMEGLDTLAVETIDIAMKEPDVRRSARSAPSIKQRIDGASEVVQIGPLTMAKNPVYGRAEDARFSARGASMLPQTMTAAFKKWFGKSKVVDADGKPLVVYHGTLSEDFSEFDTNQYEGGAFFSADPAVASHFADPERTGNDPEEEGYEPRVLPVYLSLKNPKRLDAADAMRRLPSGKLEHSFDAMRAAMLRAKAEGHDGAHIVGAVEADGVIADQWVAFRPEQIKSAIGNDGSFDAKNPDTRRAVRGAPAAAGTPDAKTLRERVRAATDWFNARTEVMGFMPDRLFYLSERYKTLGKIERYEDIAKGISKAFADATESDKKELYTFFTTAGAKESAITRPELRKVARDTKDNINAVGDALESLGMFGKPAEDMVQGKLFASDRGTRRFYDQYLPRLYLSHLLNEGDWRAIGAGKRTSDMGYLKKRQDIPEEVRRVILGEVKDPAFLAGMAIVRPMRDVSILRFLESISKRESLVMSKSMVTFDGHRVTPMWLKREADRLRNQSRYMVDRGDAAKAEALANRMDAVADPAMEALAVEDHTDWKQLPDSPRYGRMRGLYVRKEVHDDLVGVYELQPEDMKWWQPQSFLGYGGVGTKATQLWKVGKVTLNPGSQVRNIISNMVMLQLSGVAMHRLPGRIVQAMTEIANDKGAGWDVAKKYGAKQATFASQELMDLKRDAIRIQLATTKDHPIKRIAALAALMSSPVLDKARDFHQFWEYVGKTAKIIDEMAKGKGEAEAAIEAQKWLFDYSLVSPGVRYLRNAPIGSPFLTWLVKAAPRLAEVVMFHPQRLLPWIGLYYSLPMLAAAAVGGDEDDWKAMKESMAAWAQKRSMMVPVPWRDDAGRIQFTDLGPFLPWTMFSDAAGAIGKGDVAGAATGVASSFISGGPIGSMLAALATGGVDPFTDRPIVPPGEPTGRAIGHWASYLWTLWAPPWVTESGFAGKMTNAMTGSTNKYGDPRTTAGQAAATLVGLNLYGVNPDTTFALEATRMQKEIADVRIRMVQTLQDRGLSPERRQEIVLEYTDEMRRRAQKLEEYLSRASTVSPELKVKMEREPAAAR